MMTLFWFLLGVATCIGVARYNEDESLFWKLFISFIGAFAVSTYVASQMDEEEQGKVVMVENSPTQVLQSTPCMFCTLADVSLAATKREKSPKPVSKAKLLNQNNSTLSGVVRTHARGQPQFYMYFSDS